MYREPATREEVEAVRMLAARASIYVAAVSVVLTVATVVGGVAWYCLRPSPQDAAGFCADHIVSRYQTKTECRYIGQKIERLSDEVAVCRCPVAEVQP